MAAEVRGGNVGGAQAGGEVRGDDRQASTEEDEDTTTHERTGDGEGDSPGERLSVYGDSAYGAGSVLDTLEQADARVMCKVQPPVAHERERERRVPGAG